MPPPASPAADDSEVLAVYARPAPTISFELAPEPVPETLAPTTTDSVERRAIPPRNVDLSVVAASQFRDVQRSSKRLILISSLASAAVASLLTFLLSSPSPNTNVAAAAAATELSTLQPVAVKPAPEPPPSVEPARVAAAAEATAPATSAKPKAKHKARAWRPARVVAAAPRDPLAVPNPYEPKPDDAEPTKPAQNHGSGLEAVSSSTDASRPNGSSSPGF